MLMISTLIVLLAMVSLPAYLLWKYAKWVYPTIRDNDKKRWFAIGSIVLVTWLGLAVIRKIRFITISLFIAGLVYFVISVGCKYFESFNEKQIVEMIEYNKKSAIDKVADIKAAKARQAEIRRMVINGKMAHDKAVKEQLRKLAQEWQEKEDAKYIEAAKAREVFTTPVMIVNTDKERVKYDGEGRFRVSHFKEFVGVIDGKYDVWDDWTPYGNVKCDDEIKHEVKFRHPQLTEIYRRYCIGL